MTDYLIQETTTAVIKIQVISTQETKTPVPITMNTKTSEVKILVAKTPVTEILDMGTAALRTKAITTQDF